MDAALRTTAITPADSISDTIEFAVQLVAFWVCGLVWAFGTLTITHGFLYSMYGNIGLVEWQGPLRWTPSQGFVAMFIGPTVLGVVLLPNWRSFVGGALACVVSIFTPVLWFRLQSDAFAQVSNLPQLWDYPLWYQIYTDWSPFFVAQWLVTAAVVALVVVVNAKTFPPFDRRLIIGLVVGGVIAVAGCAGVIAVQQIGLNMWDSLLRQELSMEPRTTFSRFITRGYITHALYYFLWQIPPLVWVTVAYFRPGHRLLGRLFGTVLWLVLLLLTFRLPFELTDYLFHR